MRCGDITAYQAAQPHSGCEGAERVRLHQHRYLGADRRVLGLRELDVRLLSGHLRFARDQRAVSAKLGGRRGREAQL